LFKQFIFIFIFFTALSALDVKNQSSFLLKQERTWIDELKRPLRVGITIIPNQVIKSVDGYEGFSIDLFHKIESLLGIEFEYVYYDTWDDLIIAGKKREIDIVFSAQKSEHRLQYYDFTDPVLRQKNKIIVADDKSSDLRVEDLLDKRVAVVGGSAVFEYLELNYPFMTLIATKNELEALRLTVNKRADCAISEIVRASYYMKMLPKSSNLYIAGDINYDYNLRIASRSDMPILNLILSKSVEHIPLEYIESLELRWGYVQEVNTELLKKVLLLSSLALFIILLWVVLLRRENERLQEVLDSSIASMAILKNGKAIHVNKILLKKLGYSSDELLKHSFKDFVDKRCFSQLEKMLINPDKKYECKLIQKNGESFPVLLKATPLKGARYIVSFIDISEIKKVQEELERFNRTLEQKVAEGIEKNKKHERMLSQQARLAQMGEAINMIAHQWRQPLHNINGLVLMIDMRLSKQKCLPVDIVTKELDEIELISSYMSNTINDFRDFFNPLKEKVEFSIKDSIEGVLKLIQPTLDFDNVMVHLEYGVDIKYTGYPNELGQVIINILNNAKDALSTNRRKENEKEIKITIFKEFNRAVITIEDNAGGISEDIIDEIFEAYFSTKVKSKGTGLGLYISKIIIEEHMRGVLSAKNGEKGAIFRIEFQL
jgi:PAS domain S-box-containing protein